ncbi:MAG TPA: SAM-dependent chlorinase/fluorinase [Thermodesulfovibrionales bacterium]|nr:SAM-dependent chlorinase/fluorinase [Thermodesulfovibrionales bacterium]
MSNPIITLTTDFGYKDPLSGVMKGVILSINPSVSIVDMTHGISKYDVREAALTIGSTYMQFPLRTIHIVVTDPGVGSERRPIMLATDSYYFIGPDNGVFSLMFGNKRCEVRHLTSSHYFLRRISKTFHGRDIFAPVAAWLSKGIDVSKFGEVINDFVKLDLPTPIEKSSVAIEGEVILIDHFGNAITNITALDIDRIKSAANGTLKIIIKGKEVMVKDYYGQAGDRGLYGIIGSLDYLELFVNKGNASQEFNIKVGDALGIIVVGGK